MTSFIRFNNLNINQKADYNLAITKAFPKIISESEVIKKNWTKLENYFPEYQQFLIDPNEELIGFINTVPFHFNKSLSELPEFGWDWMFEKAITDYETKTNPNFLGGLQVIVKSKFQGKGFSKQILNYTKNFIKSTKLLNLVIPIRPTEKHKFPQMPMTAYLKLKNENEIYDPWIRTHIKGGAQIIKVCEKSMTMKGDIKFWESMLNKKILKSGKYKLEGALDLITIDCENNIGQYVEPNIWIKYD